MPRAISICSANTSATWPRARAYRHYIWSVEHLRELFEVHPEVVVCDLHPGYLSTQFAQKMKAESFFQVQHHWAHIASVLAEYKMEPNEQVIGLVADGTGYGTDGAIWGCECLIASLLEFERFGHLAYYPLAGGDAASKEAIRPLLGLLEGQEGSGIESILAGIEPDRKKNRNDPNTSTQANQYRANLQHGTFV